MNYFEQTESLALLGQKKASMLKQHKFSMWIGGMAAGAYVGLAILLIFTIGASIDPAYRALAMGSTFGLALILVVFAGAELFTGYVMYVFLAIRRRYISLGSGLATCGFIFIANLTGALFLVLIYKIGKGVLIIDGSSADFLQHAVHKKMNYSWVVLIARAALCNWLVCLALWMGIRLQNEAAKLIAIAWCLLAFIACGYEHSVANMTLHILALFGPENPEISLLGMGHNLLWVTIGNTLGGALLVGGVYASQSHPPKSDADSSHLSLTK